MGVQQYSDKLQNTSLKIVRRRRNEVKQCSREDVVDLARVEEIDVSTEHFEESCHFFTLPAWFFKHDVEQFLKDHEKSGCHNFVEVLLGNRCERHEPVKFFRHGTALDFDLINIWFLREVLLTRIL